MLKKGVVSSAVLSLLVVTGCASQTETDTSASTSTSGTSSAEYNRTISSKEAEIGNLETRLSSRDSRIAELEAQLSAASSGSNYPTGSGTDELFPPNARPGECYARVLFPEQYRTSEERVLAREASERFEVVPARYETVTETVLVKEASSRLEVIPAEYSTVEERVLVRPASSRIEEIPATYRTVSEQVLDKAAHTVWKKGSPESFGGAVVSQSVNGTGELMCLVEVPATYRTVTRTVVDTPATTREIEIPAEYKTVTRRVVSKPATTREVVIPAVYDEVEVTRLVEAASSRRIEIPEEYKTVTKREKISEARLEWQEVLCEVNATSSVVLELQQALDAKGYNVGGIDGRLGPGTISAVNQYAKSIGVPQGANYVPMEVLEKLDISF